MTSDRRKDFWKTASVEATRALGETLGRSLIGGITIGLVGPLGAGKTQLVKGVAAGNGAVDPRKVTSPTFTLIHEYTGRLTLYHVDAYRLRGPLELLALGFDELVRSDSAVMVEWADRVRDALPHEALWIEMTPLGETSRGLSFSASGDLAARCLEALRREGL